MLLIVYPAIFSLKSQRDDLDFMYLLLKDFVIGRKLMMVCIVLFWVIWEIGRVHLIINVVKYCDNLMNQSQHIDKVIEKQTSEEKLKNRLRLKTLIDCVRYLTSQGCAFKGHDEGPNSKDCGDFLELIKLMSVYNEDVAKVVLENAPGNAKYTSHHVQKHI